MVTSPEELEKEALTCLEEQDIAILLVTNTLADLSRSFLDGLKQRKHPLIVEIPHKEHCDENHDSITRYIQEAMGIKL